ncbi:hypothetical protein FANTH_3392 [Fusarium anthophilum]|uniref:Uncharacterized protein n=1 Tax=Fusarium anthophilum TaxID=48485 RepID=A0A8H5E9I9_9HYPO|nr:hypothetical protein FANTH_3392 [Fusarium anthophilum]
MALTKAFHDTQETAAQPGVILLVPPGQGQIQPGESPGPSGQAENLEEWWKNDTKAAAGKKLAEKEGGPSTVDELFEKTCREMAAEEAENASYLTKVVVTAHDSDDISTSPSMGPLFRAACGSG